MEEKQGRRNRKRQRERERGIALVFVACIVVAMRMVEEKRWWWKVTLAAAVTVMIVGKTIGRARLRVERGRFRKGIKGCVCNVFGVLEAPTWSLPQLGPHHGPSTSRPGHLPGAALGAPFLCKKVIIDSLHPL